MSLFFDFFGDLLLGILQFEEFWLLSISLIFCRVIINCLYKFIGLIGDYD